MLRKLIRCKYLYSSAVFLFCFYITSPVFAAVTINNGTVIPLELTDEISSKTNQVGQQAKFRVLKDIIVDNRLVIPAGSAAIGEITQLTKAGAVGKKGEVSIQVKSVYAADGEMINVTGSRYVSGDEKQTTSIVLTIICCILFLIMKGEEAVLPAGTLVDAVVLGNQSVNGKFVGRNYQPNTIAPIPIPKEEPKKKKHETKYEKMEEGRKVENNNTTTNTESYED